MHKEQEVKTMRRERRKKSVRRRLKRNHDLPRLSVHRSLKHIYAQIIADDSGRTLASAGTNTGAIRSQLEGKTKSECAAVVGSEIARLAKEKGLDKVMFDRGAGKYHGRIKALAEAAREGGLKF